MTNLDDLKVFERVAALESFSAASRALGIPKSTVSRCVARLETQLGVRLIQRTTHSVRLTEAGVALKRRCTEILTRVSEAIDYVGSLSTSPRGALRINSTIGFGYFVLSETLPKFRERFPGVDISLDLTSRPVDLVDEGFDIGIRFGALPDSSLIATGLGAMQKYLCASASYLERRGTPQSIEELIEHDTIETPCRNGVSRSWKFYKNARESEEFKVPPGMQINDPGMIYRMVVNGAGIACVPGYLAASDIKTGRLVHLLPEWTLPAVEVNVVYPSRRGLSPAVRAFVEYMKETAAIRKLWLDDLITDVSPSPHTSRT